MNIKKLLVVMLAVCISMTFCMAHAEGECEHPSHMVEVYDDVFDAKEYGNITETTHTAYGDLLYIEYCYECDTNIVEKVVETNVSEVEEHWYYGGKCQGCGYSNVCNHPEESIELETNWFDANGEYGEITETTHEAYGYNVYGYWCTACEERFEDVLSELTSEVEPHYFKDGVCDCGYINKCEHPEEYVYDEEYDATIGQLVEVTETTHSYERNYLIAKVCDKCGEFVEEKYEMRIEPEEHWFEDGECYCGYVEGTVLPADPTAAPTVAPTAAPTVAPTAAPTVEPTDAPATEEPAVPDIPGEDDTDDVPKTGDSSMSYVMLFAMILLSTAVLAMRALARNK